MVFSTLPLTDRQLQALKFIASHMDANGYPPTLRELAAHMGIRSTNGVNDHLRSLERKGMITRDDLKSRGIRLTDRARAALGQVQPQVALIEPADLSRIGAMDAGDVLALVTALHERAIPMAQAANALREAM